MAIGMNFKRKQERGSSISTASTGDIAFLLLIFFMVTTIFRRETGLPVDLPRAEAGEKVKQEQVLNIFINRRGQISIDDKLIKTTDVSKMVGQRISGDPTLVIAFKADTATPYEDVSNVMEELKAVNALRVSFNNKPDSSPGRKY